MVFIIIYMNFIKGNIDIPIGFIVAYVLFVITLITIRCYYKWYKTTTQTKLRTLLFDSIVKEEISSNTDIIFIVDGFWENQKALNKLGKYVIDIDDSETFIERIHEIDQGMNDVTKEKKPLSIILYTTGGSIFNSDMIVEILLSYDSPVNIYIPGFAYSAGSMIALCADKLYMNKFSVMGPVDPQLSYHVDDNGDEDGASAKCFMQLLEDKEEIGDDFYLKALESKNLHDDNIENLRKILRIRDRNLSKNKKKKFIEEFASGKRPHHKPFLAEKVRQLGMPVESTVPREINKLFSVYVGYKNSMTMMNSIYG